MKVCKHAQIWSKLCPLRSKFGSIQFWIASPQFAQLMLANLAQSSVVFPRQCLMITFQLGVGKYYDNILMQDEKTR